MLDMVVSFHITSGFLSVNSKHSIILNDLTSPEGVTKDGNSHLSRHAPASPAHEIRVDRQVATVRVNQSVNIVRWTQIAVKAVTHRVAQPAVIVVKTISQRRPSPIKAGRARPNLSWNRSKLDPETSVATRVNLSTLRRHYCRASAPSVFKSFASHT